MGLWEHKMLRSPNTRNNNQANLLEIGVDF